eukprot:scaffold57027_cov36-Phaeocystis_antarctica.AAC.2
MALLTMALLTMALLTMALLTMALLTMSGSNLGRSRHCRARPRAPSRAALSLRDTSAGWKRSFLAPRAAAAAAAVAVAAAAMVLSVVQAMEAAVVQRQAWARQAQWHRPVSPTVPTRSALLRSWVARAAAAVAGCSRALRRWLQTHFSSTSRCGRCAECMRVHYACAGRTSKLLLLLGVPPTACIHSNTPVATGAAVAGRVGASSAALLAAHMPRVGAGPGGESARVREQQPSAGGRRRGPLVPIGRRARQPHPNVARRESP